MKEVDNLRRVDNIASAIEATATVEKRIKEECRLIHAGLEVLVSCVMSSFGKR